MSDTHRLADQLKIASAVLFAEIEQEEQVVATRFGELEELRHDAQAREHRKAFFSARAAACYKLGAGFEPSGDLDIDPVAWAGLMSCGTSGLLLLAQVALSQPNASFGSHVRALFRSDVGREVRKRGTWVRWHWLRELYLEETERFLESTAGKDPAAKWRTKLPTSDQTYLIAQICIDLQIEYQVFDTRGEAFDWILPRGNPRFDTPPPRPNLDSLVECFG